MADKRLKVTLVRSRYGRLPTHCATIAGLGLKRMHQTVMLEDSPSIRGMIRKVSYLLRVEETG